VGHRPLHEVRDDQEVAREPHLDDHAELAFEAAPRSPAGGKAVGLASRDPGLEASRAWNASSSGSVRPSLVGKLGRIGSRLATMKAQRRAISSVLSQASGRSGEQRPHVGRRLEPMLVRDLASGRPGRRRPRQAMHSSASCAWCMEAALK
jgi:hypothetical protein